jgi:hypothetical protein
MKKISLVIAALLLAGCQTVNGAWSSVTSSDTTARPQEPGSPPNAPQTAMVAPTAPTGATSTSLTGQTGESLHALWGEPTLKRKDLGSELWQYAGKGCTLLVYLYPANGGAMTVNHAEAVPGGSDEAAISACAKAAGKPPIKPIS